jgi:hypothetical protein
MVMNIDFGGGGGSEGPFISWQARASLDGEFNGKTWVMRGPEGKVAFTGMTRGVVFDIDGMKLGWSRGDGVKGVAPEWRWNPSVSRFEPKPGDDWKRGFHIPLAISGTETAVWEQSQAGAFSAIQDLFSLIAKAQRQAGTLPVVRHNGEKKIESQRGITFAPVLEIVKWVARPSILNGGGAPAFAPEPAPAPQPARTPVMADDDVPF